MARKTFKDGLDPNNPALGFISEASIRAVDGAGRKEQQAQQADQQEQQFYTLDEAAAILKKKKGAFFGETKSRRLQLLVTPSLFEKIKTIAERRGLSINALSNAYLEAAVEKEEAEG